MRDHMNLNRLAYFAAVVDTGSFTAAARQLDVTKAVVSQQVARLEAEVGTTLLVRTTRRVQPTEAGLRFHGRCVTILQESEEAFDQLAEAAAVPSGTLRMTAQIDYGTLVIVLLATVFKQLHPACDVELSLSDQTVDLVAGNIDLAVRLGHLTDSRLQARRIGSFAQLLVAGAAHAEAACRLAGPEELPGLPFVANSALRLPLHWQFSRDDGASRSVDVQAAMSFDATIAVHKAVTAGGGLSVLPDFMVDSDIASGRLVHVLPEWTLPASGIHLVFPTARYRPSRVSAFADMLTKAERLRTRPDNLAPAGLPYPS